jgi:phosphatidylserine/phosphatidylglycerophosphate/cardiolipin synthase-like enzyme
MATSKLTTYSDTLFFLALLKAINGAQESIEVMTFVFKIQYSSSNRAQEIFDALVAAAARGVRVYVLLNYSQYEPDGGWGSPLQSWILLVLRQSSVVEEVALLFFPLFPTTPMRIWDCGLLNPEPIGTRIRAQYGQRIP